METTAFLKKHVQGTFVVHLYRLCHMPGSYFIPLGVIPSALIRS